jgi:parallel beta-helix repeat protein
MNAWQAVPARRLLGLALAAWIAGAAAGLAAPPSGSIQRADVHVGIDTGDLRGSDHRALQAAVDYVAGLGGGTVHVGPGRYLMRNALVLRDNVDVVGVPGKTILAACGGCRSLLAADGDCRECQVTLADSAGFRVGDGVAVVDKRSANGYEVTTATLTAQVDRNTFRISEPLYLDYMVANKAAAKLVFPVVGGWNVKNVLVEGLTIDGNRGKSESLDGCRGGGIYLFQSEDVTLRNCTVHRYNGDGISFQVSQRVTVEECLCENNAGLGLHPGSGSQHPILRRNRSLNNDGDGLFVCWRVKYGLFENNEIRGNKNCGISIGHKDTDNLFRNNTISENGAAGILFRSEDENMGAHRNVYEDNRIVDNGLSGRSDAPKAAIVIRGHHCDLVFRRNVIGNSKPGAGPAVGILSGKHAPGLRSEENRFLNVATEVEVEQ